MHLAAYPIEDCFVDHGRPQERHICVGDPIIQQAFIVGIASVEEAPADTAAPLLEKLLELSLCDLGVQMSCGLKLTQTPNGHRPLNHTSVDEFLPPGSNDE